MRVQFFWFRENVCWKIVDMTATWQEWNQTRTASHSLPPQVLVELCTKTLTALWSIKCMALLRKHVHATGLSTAQENDTIVNLHKVQSLEFDVLMQHCTLRSLDVTIWHLRPDRGLYIGLGFTSCRCMLTQNWFIVIDWHLCFNFLGKLWFHSWFEAAYWFWEWLCSCINLNAWVNCWACRFECSFGSKALSRISFRTDSKTLNGRDAPSLEYTSAIFKLWVWYPRLRRSSKEHPRFAAKLRHVMSLSMNEKSPWPACHCCPLARGLSSSYRLLLN